MSPNTLVELVLTLIRMAIKKDKAMWLGVICDSQVTNSTQGGLPVKAPLLCRTSIGVLGIIYDSQLARIHKITITNKWKLLLFD
jgi:hypothetical protein